MISIVIPVFNEEKEIEKTVRQFAALKLPHEVIVSDTLSTDGTVGIAKRCADKVVMMSPDKKRGVSHGRNNGARAAKGEFIVFLDSDTMIPSINAFFAKALARFEKNPRLVGLSVRVEVSPGNRTMSDAIVFGLMNAEFAFLSNVFNFGMAAGKFQMIKADAFRETGGFNEDLYTAEDIDLFGRLSKLGRVRIAWDLVVLHSGRRFHHVGAWRTLFRWIKNAMSFWLFKKSADKEWENIR